MTDPCLQESQHGRVRTPFFPGTGGVPPLFREREPPSVPTSAKRGFAKNFRVPGKKGERPESGFGSGNDQTPYAPEMPVPPSRSHFRSGFTSTPVLFPLLVPTSVPGFARCCLFRVPFPQRENPQLRSTPRGVSEKATFLSSNKRKLWTVLWVRMMNKIIWIRSGTIYFWALKRRTRTA